MDTSRISSLELSPVSMTTKKDVTNERDEEVKTKTPGEVFLIEWVQKQSPKREFP